MIRGIETACNNEFIKNTRTTLRYTMNMNTDAKMIMDICTKMNIRYVLVNVNA